MNCGKNVMSHKKDMGEILGIQLRSYQCYEAATAARTMRNWWPWRITST